MEGRRGDGFPSEILPGFLFLGDSSHGSNPTMLREAGIYNVVNLLPTLFSLNAEHQRSKDEPDIVLFHCPADDHPKYQLAPSFGAIFPFIEEVQKRNERVLVHCGEGVSRAPTVVLGYLMAHKGMKLSEAIMYTIARRSKINPNNGFMRQLLAYEESIHHESSIDAKYFEDDWGSGCVVFACEEIKRLKGNGTM